MKVSREQVQQNRARILDAAATLFRERGFDDVTVAEVMQAAGLTHGAFYGHFSNKEDLVNQAVAHVPTEARRAEIAAIKDPVDYANAYLLKSHRDNVGTSCPMSSMGTDAARASGSVRKTLTAALKRGIAWFGPVSQGKTAEEQRRAAIANWSAMVGAIVLSRMVDDASLSDEILAATRDSLHFRQ
jgi:TetR/AcrR family transcriptional repressor of nem operon